MGISNKLPVRPRGQGDRSQTLPPAQCRYSPHDDQHRRIGPWIATLIRWARPQSSSGGRTTQDTSPEYLGRLSRPEPFRPGAPGLTAAAPLNIRVPFGENSLATTADTGGLRHDILTTASNGRRNKGQRSKLHRQHRQGHGAMGLDGRQLMQVPAHCTSGGETDAFALDFGPVCDIEAACGDTGIGGIYAPGHASISVPARSDQTIRHGLIGGGLLRADAERPMKTRFDEIPLADSGCAGGRPGGA